MEGKGVGIGLKPGGTWARFEERRWVGVFRSRRNYVAQWASVLYLTVEWFQRDSDKRPASLDAMAFKRHTVARAASIRISRYLNIPCVPVVLVRCSFARVSTNEYHGTPTLSVSPRTLIVLMRANSWLIDESLISYVHPVITSFSVRFEEADYCPEYWKFWQFSKTYPPLPPSSIGTIGTLLHLFEQ